MEINDFKKGRIYKRSQLIEAFGGSFMGGMNICKRTNTLALISKSTKDRIYNDYWRNGLLHYTGMGQIGDQKFTNANKVLLESPITKIPVHLFEVFKEGEYTYYGRVLLAGKTYFERESDTNGIERSVIKFPLKLADIELLSDTEMNGIFAGDLKLPEVIPTYKVVAAAIFKDYKLLCAKRNHGMLKDKWEFPGGKVANDETEIDALAREIKEELNIDIKIQKHIDRTYYSYEKMNINLSVYQAEIIGGELKQHDHSEIKWLEISEAKLLDWAPADIPILDVIEEMMPGKIIGEPVKYDYFENTPVANEKRELNRSLQDYEASQKTKSENGRKAEWAALQYEKDKLCNIGRPDLSDEIEPLFLKTADKGYDIKSFNVENGQTIELHIEIKLVKITDNYITFFISENELTHFKNDEHYLIYCLYRRGKDYQLHIVNKNLFSDKYLMPLNYVVKIRIAP